MALTGTQTLILALMAALGTAATRFAPFLLFPESKEIPPVVLFLGKYLPPAMMGLLIVYCLKDVSLTAAPHGAPEMIAIALIALVHLKFRNVLLSVLGGTALYMVLLQFVF